MERVAAGYGLIEGPAWDGEGLVFSDVVHGGVRRLAEDGTLADVWPHRRGVGGIGLHADGGVVVTGRNVSWRRPDGETVVLLDRRDEQQSFNDMTTDPDGRIYVGSLEFAVLDAGARGQPGELFLIDLDGSVEQVADDVRLTNGLAVSPDGTWLYHADTHAHTVWRYPRRPDGRLGGREPHHRWADGMPDGIAADAAGRVYVAMASGGTVDVIGTDGELETQLPVEVPMVTSVCFGGADLGTLFVVTGSDGAPAPDAGAVYRTPAVDPGLPVAPVRVRPG